MPGYTNPDGWTLKNKIGATNDAELERLEAAPVARRILEIEMGSGPAATFDISHLKTLHRHIFQDVYEWAGHTRDERIRLSDGEIAYEPTLQKIGGKPFASNADITTKINDVTRKIRSERYLSGLSRKGFVQRAAGLFSELNSIHPFREGNGRVQRTFFEQLAERAGHQLDFTGITLHRMTLASQTAHEENDLSLLIRMFDEISNPKRSDLLNAGLEKLKRHQNINPKTLYLTTFSPGETSTVIFAGIADDQFLARTNDRVFFGRAANLPSPIPQIGTEFEFHEPRINDEPPPGDPPSGPIRPRRPTGRGGMGD
jgi:cell filamentation protein